MLGCSHELYTGTAQQVLGMPVVKSHVCQGAGGDGVAGRQQPDKAPVPQLLNEGAAGPLRIPRSREESSPGTR